MTWHDIQPYFIGFVVGIAVCGLIVWISTLCMIHNYRKRKNAGITKKKPHSLTLYVVFSICALITYTIVSQIVFWKTGMEYGTLTACFYAAFGGEVLMCALIKIFKLKDTREDHNYGN